MVESELYYVDYDPATGNIYTSYKMAGDVILPPPYSGLTRRSSAFYVENLAEYRVDVSKVYAYNEDVKLIKTENVVELVPATFSL